MNKKEALESDWALLYTALQESPETRDLPIALTNGCFDLFHEGHQHLLSNINKKREQIICVAINSDEDVKKLKGFDRPINDENKRADDVHGFLEDSFVFLFGGELSMVDVINIIKPDYYYKGEDYNMLTIDPDEKDALFSSNPNVKVEFLPFLTGYSTTLIFDAIQHEQMK